MIIQSVNIFPKDLFFAFVKAGLFHINGFHVPTDIK